MLPHHKDVINESLPDFRFQWACIQYLFFNIVHEDDGIVWGHARAHRCPWDLVICFIVKLCRFLQVLQSIDVQPEDYLVTIDVSSLYTNIPHKEGIDYIMDWMPQKGISTEESGFIADLAKLVLECNYFEFDNKTYHQVSGTAMGTRMAPNYATIFMHYIEEKILNTSPLKPKIWKWFIDDIFMVWQHGKDTLDEFLKFINILHPTIKFTAEYSLHEISFLDTMVWKEKDRLTTRVYHKKTDSKRYLHFNSAHPYSQKKAILDSVENNLDINFNLASF